MAAVETIGFVGIGMMGQPMAANLANAGYALSIFDLDPGHSAAFAEAHAGTKITNSLAELGATVSTIITMLPDGKIVRSALCGKDDSFQDCLLERAGANTLVIDMSSSSPLDTRALGALLAARGIAVIDAPVSGGVKGALAASLAIMVGGEAQLYQRARPLLAKLGSKLFHAGPLGSGHAIKALNNYLSATALVASCEVLIAAERFGLDPAVATDIINASTGMNNTTLNKAKQHMLSGSFAAGFATSLMAKDLRTALEVIEAGALPDARAQAQVGFWNEAASTLPPGSDHTAVYKLIAEAKQT